MTPIKSNNYWNLLENVGKATSCLQNFKELQQLLDSSENYWKYRLRLALYQYVPGRMLTLLTLPCTDIYQPGHVTQIETFAITYCNHYSILPENVGVEEGNHLLKYQKNHHPGGRNCCIFYYDSNFKKILYLTGFKLS